MSIVYSFWSYFHNGDSIYASIITTGLDTQCEWKNCNVWSHKFEMNTSFEAAPHQLYDMQLIAKYITMRLTMPCWLIITARICRCLSPSLPVIFVAARLFMNLCRHLHWKVFVLKCTIRLRCCSSSTFSLKSGLHIRFLYGFFVKFRVDGVAARLVMLKLSIRCDRLSH